MARRYHDLDEGEETETGQWEPLVVLPRELGQVPPPPDLIGVKAHGLAQLLVVKARTPRFGVLTRPAFDLHLAQEPLPTVLRDARAADLDDEAARAAWSEKLVRHVAAIGLPDELDWGIDELLGAFKPDDKLAVRASVAAPLAEAAYVRGCFETALFVQGEEDLREAVVRVFASAFSARHLEARYAAGLDPLGGRVAVIVQRMIDAEISGTCRSLDASGPPGQDAHVEILSTFGLAGGMARGRGSAGIYLDSVHVPRPVVADEGIDDEAPVALTPANKQEALRFDEEHGRGTRLVRLPEEEQTRGSLTRVQARLVAAEALRIEAALGGPQVLEFAFAGRLLHVLQVSPLFTPMGRIESKRLRTWDERLVPEGIRGITTPLSYSVFKSTFLPAFVSALERLGGPARDLAERRAVLGRVMGLLRGRVVLNVSAVAAFLDLLPEGALVSDGWARTLGVSSLARASDDRSLDEDTLKVGRLLKTSRRLATELDPALAGIATALNGLMAGELDDKDPDRILDTVELVLVQGRHAETEQLICDGCAAAFYGVLERMVARWLPGARAGLVNDLFAGEETEETRRVNTVVHGLSALVESDPVLKGVFDQEQSGTALLDRLDGLPAADGLWRELKSGLRIIGGRFLVERKLEAPGLAERPDLLLDLVRRQLEDPFSDAERMLMAEGIRKKAEYALYEQLPDRRIGLGRTSRKKLLERVLLETREALARRRRIRACQSEIWSALRRLVLVLGQRLFEHSVLAQPADVFYLTLDELRGLVRGTAVDADPQPVIANRKRAALRFPVELPEAFETVGVLATADLRSLAAEEQPDDDDGGGPLTGRPSSSGEVEGEVRHLAIREDAGGFEVLSGLLPPPPGGVLVVRRPDPGLLPMLAAADAVITERGDLLSPGVVALRALGVPTVIGVPRALERLQTGERVRVVARLGRIERLSPPVALPAATQTIHEATTLEPAPSAPETELVSHALSGSQTGRPLPTTLEGGAMPVSADHDEETQVFYEDQLRSRASRADGCPLDDESSDDEPSDEEPLDEEPLSDEPPPPSDEGAPGG